MRVFLTGGTGYVGGAVARALLKRGHEVAALVRSESDDSELRGHGTVIIAGDLSSLPQLSNTLGAYDVLVHTAFAGTDPVAQDRLAVDTMSKQDGFFLYTSGVWVLGNGDKLSESSPVNPLPLVAWRPAHEKIALTKGAVIRPGCVYGGKQSLLAEWFASADQKRALKVVGDGKNRWAMVHIEDLADCYVRIIEQRVKGIFHGIDDTHSTINECAAAVSKKIEHVPAEGMLAPALTVDQVVSSETTRKKLGWLPRRTFVSSIEEQWREWRAATRA